MKRHIFLTTLSLIILAIPLFLLGSEPDRKIDSGPQVQSSSTQKVSAIISPYRFTLFGYTSPKADVVIEGLGIYDTTEADDTGFFIFFNRFSPLSPREPCIWSKDISGRSTPPLCIAPFTVSRYAVIGPVILPPSISVNGGHYFVGDRAVLSGQTLPNSDVNFAFFIDEKKTNQYQKQPLSLIKKAYAYSFPSLEGKSDEKGFFSIQIPTDQPAFMRVYSSVFFNGEEKQILDIEKLPSATSPKSITLQTNIYPWWMTIIFFLTSLFNAIKNNLLQTLFLLLILIAIIYLINEFKPHLLKKRNMLAKSTILPPEIEPVKSIMKYRSIKDKLLL